MGVKVEKITKEMREGEKQWKKEAKANNPYGTFSNLGFVIKEAWHHNRPLIFVSFMLIFVAALQNVCNVFFSKYVVELALAKDDRTSLIIYCAVLFAVSTFTIIAIRAGELYLNNKGKFKMSHHFCMLLKDKMMTIDYQSLEKTHTNDMFWQASMSADWVSTDSFHAMRLTATSVIEMAAFSGILSMLSPVMIVIVAVPSILGYYINMHKMEWIWQMSNRWSVHERKMDYIKRQMSELDRAKDIRVFNMQNWLIKAFSKVFGDRMDWWRQQDKWENRWETVEMLLVTSLGDFAAYAYIIYLVVNGGISAGDFILYFNSILNFSRSVRSWCDNFSGYQWLSNNIAFLRNYLNLKDETNRGEGVAIPDGQCEIEFRNVTYTYCGAEKPTINNISFKLHKGERLALVGLNGAGKTTLIKLMCGLYDPTDGEILLNGIPVNEYNRDEYLDTFAAVFQDISVLPVSVCQMNIYGKADTIDSEKAVNTAAMKYMLAKLELVNSELSEELNRNVASHITGRIKNEQSIRSKLLRKKLALSAENIKSHINDIVGVRAVCFFVDDLYKFGQKIANHPDITVIKIKDYITQPKSSGYRSLHLICELLLPYHSSTEKIKIEIQLRTNAMDYWAELDNQLHYKKDNEKSEQVSQKLKAYADEIEDIDKKMMRLRDKINRL